jgi:Mg-chelatase subunit ChlD
VLVAGVLAAVGLLPGSASADVSGTAVTQDGSPLWSVMVYAVDAAGQTLPSGPGTLYTDAAGAFTLKVPNPAPPFPLTVTYRYGDDGCPDHPGQALTVTRTAAADGVALAPVTFPVPEFCSNFGSGTAYVDDRAGYIVAAPGDFAEIRLPVPYGTTGLKILYNGAVIGDSKLFEDAYGYAYIALLTAPTVSGSGTMTATYTFGGTAYSRTVGPLVVTGGATRAAASAGADIEVALDISGSMNGTDPAFVRRDAVRALLDLARGNDRLGVFGFDDTFEPIFDLQPVTTGNSATLAALVDQHVIDRGETDYNVAFTHAYSALTANGVFDPSRPKRVIFLTDGAHDVGNYLNQHLLLAANSTARPWPVCVVQLGGSLMPTSATTLLQRIALETGGEFVSLSSPNDLADAFRRCLGAATAQQTLVDESVMFRALVKRKTVTRRITGAPGVATFFVSFAPGGEVTPVLTDPAGRRHTPKAPGKNVIVRRSGTFVLFKVRHPLRGRWTVTMTPSRLSHGVLAARVSVMVGRS